MHPFRTHTCGELRPEHVGEKVRLSGWVHRVRDHGGIIFIDLRDHYGITQVVIHPERSFYQNAERWHLESVLCFTGKVTRREEDTINDKINTGRIELDAEEMETLNHCEDLPIQVAKEDDAGENIRLQYRFLDLRRQDIHQRIVMRSQIISEMRRLMTEMSFLEIQTPILTRSSPEGARDFLVPSRLHPGKFYALPQAPQLFKQLLMTSGFDRYFQVAPCFRDEDARADRSPGEFYQLDIEMAYATQDDVFAAMEHLFTELFNKFSNDPVTEAPFQRIAYRDAMLRYGTDKPDLRIPIEICDVTNVFADSAFKAFASVVKKGGIVRALPVKGIGGQSRGFFDNMIAFTQECGGKGLGYIVWEDDGVKSPIAKFLTEEELQQLTDAGNMQPGDVMFFVADKKEKAPIIAGQVRIELANQLQLRDENRYEFCWIVDYPMFEWNEEHERIDFSHNPFSMPQGGTEALNQEDPLEILGYQYDLVCNGVELSSGAIRNHDPEGLIKAFEIASYKRETVENKFEGLLRALRFGAPPHGGIAPGVERVVMLLCKVANIREVTPFPLNQSAHDPLLGAPSEANARQLRELTIKHIKKA